MLEVRHRGLGGGYLETIAAEKERGMDFGLCRERWGWEEEGGRNLGAGLVFAWKRGDGRMH